MRRFLKTKQIAAKYGFDEKFVRNLCYSRGQRFAIRFAPNGPWWIDEELFDEHLERYQKMVSKNHGKVNHSYRFGG